MVIDFSPTVLGLAEGFSQVGYDIAAGVGFSTIHDMTWKVRFTEGFSLSFRLTLLPGLRLDIIQQRSMMMEQMMCLDKLMVGNCHILTG